MYFRVPFFGPLRRISRRSLTSLVAPEGEEGLVVKRRRTTNKTSIFDQVFEHLKSSEHFMNHYEKMGKLATKSVSPKSLASYCVRESTAAAIFDSIKCHISPDVPIVEVNPGLGLLTRKILDFNVKKIYAFEKNVYFLSVLSNLATECGGRLKLVNNHFLKLWHDQLNDSMDGGSRIQDIFSDLEPKTLEDGPVLQIVGTAISPRYIQYFNSCITFQHGIVGFGSFEGYLVLSPVVYWRINFQKTGIPCRYSKYVLFNIYFDYEILCEVPVKDFLPWLSKNKNAFLEKLNVSNDYLYLVKITPKTGLLKDIPSNLLKPLWYFTLQGILASSTKVIPFLEKWIPGCGPIFIAKGLNVYTEFRDLNSSEILDVFLTFAALPEFENCVLHSALESHLFKSTVESMYDDCNPTSPTPINSGHKSTKPD